MGMRRDSFVFGCCFHKTSERASFKEGELLVLCSSGCQV